jgi:hypothetical protein
MIFLLEGHWKRNVGLKHASDGIHGKVFSTETTTAVLLGREIRIRVVFVGGQGCGEGSEENDSDAHVCVGVVVVLVGWVVVC